MKKKSSLGRRILDWIHLSYYFFTHKETIAYFVDNESDPKSIKEFRTHNLVHEWYREYFRFIEEIQHYQLKKYFNLDIHHD